MRVFKQLMLFSFLVVVVFACRKKETIEVDLHRNIVTDTSFTPPPYNGVSTVVIENYVNKVYIDLLGREPSDAELAADVATLKNGNLSDAAKGEVADRVLANKEYYQRFFEIVSGNMLQGIDSAFLVDEQIPLLMAVQSLLYQQGDTVNGDAFQVLIDNTVELLDAKPDYQNGTITINEFYRRMINNPIYDDINMGSENFSVACFEHLYHRLPTAAELAASVQMVDGVNSVLFLTEGNSKPEFMDIVIAQDDFDEGLVIGAYLNLVLRQPNSSEMAAATEKLLNGTYDYLGMQKEIIITQEYAGF